jgi:hypothetical protein
MPRLIYTPPLPPPSKDPPVPIQQGDWLGPRAGLDGCEERRLFCSWSELSHNPSVYVNNGNNNNNNNNNNNMYSLGQVCSAFYMVGAKFAKFGLHVGIMKFNALNEK